MWNALVLPTVAVSQLQGRRFDLSVLSLVPQGIDRRSGSDDFVVAVVGRYLGADDFQIDVLFGSQRAHKSRLQVFRSASSVADAAKNAKAFRDNPFGRMLIAAGDEIASGKKGGVSGRVSQRMGIVQAEVGEELSAGMGIFATVGSIAAFVGLFGTVWGIMNSFIGIAQTQTTNLAVVAPGIAEALFATGIGLFAAVPAVIFYNMFARRIGAYQTRMDNFSSEILVRVAREFEA